VGGGGWGGGVWGGVVGGWGGGGWGVGVGGGLLFPGGVLFVQALWRSFLP